jgi:hypothetical protein
MTVAMLFSGLESPVGVGIHLGRSGLVVLDGDRPEDLEQQHPGVLLPGPWIHQGARDRRSYVYTQPAEQVGQARMSWGEIKAQVGYIVLAPSAHHSGVAYQWLSTPGEAPGVLPESIRALLPTAGDGGHEKATTAEVLRFMERASAAMKPQVLQVIVQELRRRASEGAGLHPSMPDLLAWAMSEADAGAYPAREAAATLHAEWLEAYAVQGRKPRADQAEEWRGLVAWAVGQALHQSSEQKGARLERLGLDPLDKALCLTSDVASVVPMLPGSFWASRPSLVSVRRAAITRGVGPDGLLLACLVRATTALDHRWVLPPTVGTLASLNLFGCLAAPSGASKSTAIGLSREIVWTGPDLQEIPMGSSGGLVDAYGEKEPGGWVQTVHNLLVEAQEVDDFVANLAVGVGTGGMVRSAAMGERLGGSYRGKDSKARVPALSYRMGILVGAQPRRLGDLLSGKERDGGTPQRFVWLSATIDPETPDSPPDSRDVEILPYVPWIQPESAWRWDDVDEPTHPDGSKTGIQRLVIQVEESVRAQVWADHRAQQRAAAAGNAGGLDGHRNLVRLKVAVALGLLEGPGRGPGVYLTREDWDLSGEVMDASDEVRSWLEDAIQGVEVDAQVAMLGAKDEAQRVNRQAVGRAALAIESYLTANPEPITATALRKALNSRQRPAFHPGLERLLAGGQVAQDADGLLTLGE